MTEPLSDKTAKKLKVLESNLSAMFPTQIITHYTSQERFNCLCAYGEHKNFAAYFRLLIADFIDKSAERALYLDTDTLVMCDIRELWDVDFEGSTALVVKDILEQSVYIERFIKLGFKNNFDTNKYFNSGVMMMNIKEWRRLPLNDIFSFDTSVVADQDFLNYIVYGKTKLLPFAWNMQWRDKRILEFDSSSQIKHGKLLMSSISEDEFEIANTKPKIVHFVFSKPWFKSYIKIDNKFVVHPYAKEWMRVAKMTPFGSEIYSNYIKETIAFWLRQYIPFVYKALHGTKRILKPYKQKIAR
ncbi:glycosyltransferase family 8 protein [Helicobacter sp. 'CLO3_human']|nr:MULTISPECIES: glycosyltransferase [unclassified Helicobacter]